MRAAWFTLLLSLGLGLGGNTALAADETIAATEGSGGSHTAATLTQSPEGPAAAALTPVIGIDPTSLDFGQACVGQCEDLVIELFNDVDDPTSSLEITSLAAEGDGFTLFNAPSTPFTIAGGNPGPRVQVTVRFCPATPGAKTGTFTVTGSGSNSPVTAGLAGVGNRAPVCDAGGPYTGTVGQAVSFDGTGSSDPDNDALSFSWNFGDGSTGTGDSPTHSYASAGAFTVTLTVTDGCNASNQCSTTATISDQSNEPPVCDAGGPYSGTAGQAVTFDGTGSSDPDGTVDSYAWDFGDGSTGTGASPTHTYATSGTFTVGLTVTDNGGATSSCGSTATIEPAANQPPVCDADGPYNGTVGVAVTFDGTGSSDPDGTVASYAWDFGDGSTGTGASPTHTYTTAGTFTVTLTVTDDDAASSTCTSTANITAEPNEPPTCNAGGPYTGTAGQPVSFDGSGSSDPDGTIDSYAWDFGDGGTDTGATPTHVYVTSGTFTVTLTVTDNLGASSTCTTTAEIAPIPNEPPVCDAGGPYNGTVNVAVNFDGSGSSDPDGTIVTYDWNFGDGSTGTGATPTHTYTSTGSFTVTLFVTDDDGDSSTCTTTANITETPNEPPTCDAGGPYTGTVNVAVAFDGSGSSDPDGTIDSYAWDFGDGSTGTGATPTHTYTSAGTFTVGLTVTDNQGGSSSCSTTATIEGENQPPVCDANGPYNGTVNQPVAFDGSGSSDPDGSIASYAWDFGDGSTGTGATPSHTYTAAGTFTVTLTVTDNEGASSTCTSTANITDEANQPPVCDANGPYSGTVGQSITFDGTGSSDPDGSIASYAWDFGDGSTGTGDSPTHTYAAAGTFTVTLTVTDNEGASSTCTSTATITGTGGNQPPDCSGARPNQAEIWPPNGQFTRVSILGVTDPNGDPVTITIDGVTQDEPLSGPGYGNKCPDARLNGTLELRAERGGPGDGRVYEVAFTATDGRGGSCSGTVTVCVPKNQAPNNECHDSGQDHDSFGPCNQVRSEDETPKLALSAAVVSGSVLVDYELAQDSKVDISVFDVTGRRIAALVSSHQIQGTHQLSWAAQGVARGVYYMRIETPAGNLTRRIVLVR